MSDMVRNNQKKWIIDQAIHETISEYNNDKLRKKAFLSLLEVIRRQSTLLCPKHILREDNSSSLKTCFHGLSNITHHYQNWIRPPVLWETKEEGLLKQFQSLVNHLFTNQEVPNFMIWVWLREPGYECWQQQNWYRHLGLGNNIRGANIPVKLTKKMAQTFVNSPDHYSVEQALTYSKFGTPEKVTPYEFGTSRRRRKWLLVKIKQFNQNLNEKWKRVAISDFNYEEEDVSAWSYRKWSIQQLRNRSELIEEGNVLHHCVAEYSGLCSIGKTTIWSMQYGGCLTTRRSITIEVDPVNRKIIQARGKYNRWPTEQEEEIIQKWAEQENLQIAI